ncbi:MAG: hypothetical protein IKL82_00270 [Clostridia bacterium]|nr:hypothetical protein [Clostridia bacterium]
MKKRSVAAIVLGVIAIIAALLSMPSDAMLEYILDEVPGDVEEIMILGFQVLKGFVIVTAIITALCVVFNTKKGANVTLIVFGVIEIMFVLTFFVGLFSIISGAVANSHINKLKLYEATHAAQAE